MVSFEALNNLMHTFIFTFFRLPGHPKHWFCTVFNTLACAQSKNDKMCILGLKLGDALTKVWISVIFVAIECNLLCDITWFFCILSWSWKKIIAFSRFCLIWGVENCTKLFFKVSWKPRIWKNKSVHKINWNRIIPHFKYGVLTTFLSIQRLRCWKMYRTNF